jgi:putative ubiquitin-RnfH superfamily antitoxin RatB of RatAB toxin-antitoxin module
MKLCLVYSPEPRRVLEWTVELPAQSTAQQGLDQLQALLQAHAPGDIPVTPSAMTLAVWGRKATPHQVLREGDRLEWLRPLRVDPKLARRERFQQQGARNTGLFARRRAGAKQGY